MFAPCWFSSLLLADICWCCLGSCEGWPGAGCPAAQDSCLRSPAPAPRTEPLTTQEHVPQGTRGLPGCRMPVLSSLYFLEVVVRVSDSDCSRSAVYILLKTPCRVTSPALVMHRGREEARPGKQKRKVLIWKSLLFLLPPECFESWVWEIQIIANSCSYRTHAAWEGLSIALGLSDNGGKDPFSICCELSCVLPKFLCWSPTSSVFGDRTLKDVIKLKWGH